jgi:ribosome recycling factor
MSQNEMIDFVLEDCEDKMKKTIDALKHSFTEIRTGKASPSMLNGVKVDYYGAPTPISQVGNITTPDARQIIIKPWDKSLIKEIVKAIATANLGLNPLAEADIVRIPVPALTEDLRRDLTKRAKKVAEENKVAIRNVRREAMETLKKSQKDGDISEDESKGATDDVQKLTDKYIALNDTLSKEKETDIMTI